MTTTKIATRIWRDPDFRGLPMHAKLAALTIITDPEMAPGCNVDVPALNHTLGWAPDVLDAALDDLSERELIVSDVTGRRALGDKLLAFLHPASAARFTRHTAPT